jgi:SET domain-containing protein
MPTKRKRKTPGERAGGTRANAKLSARAKRGIDARHPWKEEPNPYFELRTSEIQGTGAFAIRTIRKGTRIIEYLGQRVSWRTADKRYDDEKMSRHHTFLFTVDDKTCIDAAVNGNDARFINHSCEPNCRFDIRRNDAWIVSLRRIDPNEELLLDYRFSHRQPAVPCYCGAATCRGMINVRRPLRKIAR